MDYWILATSIGSFLLLFCLLLIAFRIAHAYDAVGWYVQLSAFCAVVCVGSWWGISLLEWIHITPEQLTVGIVTSLLLYGLMVILFLFGVFGVFEASITLHLLTKIMLAGKSGIHPNAILASYNRNTIVKRRVDRFLWSQELVVVAGQYRLSKRLSYFMIREYFLDILRQVFPKP
jgi:hypothetical protein